MNERINKSMHCIEEFTALQLIKVGASNKFIFCNYNHY